MCLFWSIFSKLKLTVIRPNCYLSATFYCIQENSPLVTLRNGKVTQNFVTLLLKMRQNSNFNIITGCNKKMDPLSIVMYYSQGFHFLLHPVYSLQLMSSKRINSCNLPDRISFKGRIGAIHLLRKKMSGNDAKDQVISQ